MTDDLTDAQRERLFELCFPEVSVRGAIYPEDAALALMGFAQVINMGDGEVTNATHDGQRLALALRKRRDESGN